MRDEMTPPHLSSRSADAPAQMDLLEIPAPGPAAPAKAQAGEGNEEPVAAAMMAAVTLTPAAPVPASPLSASPPAASQAERLEAWKSQLRRDLEEWLAAVDAIPGTPDTPDTDEAGEADAPDLYSFFEQMAAGNAEARKANRRLVETFGQWNETLARFDTGLRLLREQLAQLPAPGERSLSRSWCLALTEILDRARRLGAAFASPPATSWWRGGSHWRTAWEAQAQGFDILVSHLAELLKTAGVTAVSVANQPFDPATMVAVATEPNPNLPHHTVIEEFAPAYRLGGECIRVAQVKVSTNKP